MLWLSLVGAGAMLDGFGESSSDLKNGWMSEKP